MWLLGLTLIGFNLLFLYIAWCFFSTLSVWLAKKVFIPIANTISRVVLNMASKLGDTLPKPENAFRKATSILHRTSLSHQACACLVLFLLLGLLWGVN